MIIRFVAPILGLDWNEELEQIKIDKYSITKNADFLFKNFNDKNLIANVGLIHISKLETHPCIYYIGESKELFQDSNLYELIHKINADVNLMINSLWYINDNSVFVHNAYIQDIETGNVLLNTRGQITKADGQFTLTSINKDHIDKINVFSYKTKCLLISPVINRGPENPNHDGFLIKQSDSNYSVHQTENRIQRAIKFLFLARSTSYVATKITYYIAIHECLFSTKKYGIKKQISERCSYFVGGDANKRQEIYTLLEKAYDIRSYYVHGSGDKIEETYELLIEISNEVDEITRKVLNKVINIYEIVFYKDDLNIDNWFSELMCV